MGFASLQRAAPVGAADPIAARLDAASQAIDGHFLALGGVLADAVEGLGKLVGSLDQVERALDPATVAETTQELRAAADDLLTLPARQAERTEVTRRLAGAADRLADDVDDMRRTLAYLRVFAINIKITAGGIASAGGEFGDFAQEIGDCIELGRAQLDQFEADLKSLRGDFRTAFNQEQDLVEQCGKLLPAVPDGLVDSAAAMASYHQKIGQVAAEVANLVRGIQKKTGSALGALQIGDITRQRIEHASEGLSLLAELGGLDPDQKARITAFVYRLLEAQLRAAAEDFHRDVPKIIDAMGSIATDAQDILRLRDLALGRAKTDDKGFLRQLETRVDQAQSLIDDMAEADHKALKMGVEVSRSATHLSEQITQLRSIKTDVQYMALNTTLKCGRLGDAGEPLAVIAVELRLHAGHMDTSAEAALAALADLTAQAGQMANADGAAESGLTTSLDGVALRLKTLGDKVEADLVSLAREGEAVVEGLRGARRHLDFEHKLGSVIEQATESLSDGAGAAPIATADIEQPLSDLLAKIAKRYTMAQERDIHHRIAGSLAAAPAQAETPAASEEADLDDVLF